MTADCFFAKKEQYGSLANLYSFRFQTVQFFTLIILPYRPYRRSYKTFVHIQEIGNDPLYRCIIQYISNILFLSPAFHFLLKYHINPADKGDLRISYRYNRMIPKIFNVLTDIMKTTVTKASMN